MGLRWRSLSSRLMRRVGVLVLLHAGACMGAPDSSLLTSNDTAAISAALGRLNMTPADLGFEKDVAKPRWALTWVRETLCDPLRLATTAGRIRAAATGDAASVWRLSAELLEAAPVSPAPVVADVRPASSNALTPPLAGYLREFVGQAAVAQQALDRALAAVPPAARSYTAASLLGGLLMIEDHPERIGPMVAAGMARGDIDRVLAEALDLDPEPAASNVLDVVLGVDLGELTRGGQVLQAAAARLAVQAGAVRDWPTTPVIVETALGRLVVGTTGPDRYDAPALLVLDPGGNDRYAGAVGVANGLQGAPVAVIVDLGGDDTYAGTQVLGPGSALFGLAVLIDTGGDDTYRATMAGQGAAVCGAAWLEDDGGDDTYRGIVFCQGAAVAGVGVLVDTEGNDLYEVGLSGQAYSGMRGAGWLIDRAGDDQYMAGNREHDWDRHPDRFLSLAQGFSIGMRPFAGGGVAALVDLAGNDTYVADVYGQGVSYWYSAGFLIDAAGNDTYRMFHYGQGSGIHLSLGLLWDGAGDDSYTGSVLAQGNAHDYAVGLLIDRAGNDTYTADTYSQGRGLYNAFGLLLDGGGDDAYFARQTNECQGLGHDGAPREYGSLGMLVDVAGHDHYACGATEACATLRPWYGVIWDGDPGLPPDRMARAGLRVMSHVAEARLRAAHPKTGASAAGPVDSGVPPKAPVFEVATLDWPHLSIEQILVLAQHPGNSATDRSIRRDAGEELQARGAPALAGLMRYAHYENMTIQLRTQELVDAFPGTNAVRVLAGFLSDVHPRTRRLAAYYLGSSDRSAAGVVTRFPMEGGAPSPPGLDRTERGHDGACPSTVSRVRGLLADEETAGAAIRTLGKWRDRESVPLIIHWLAEGKEPRRVAAANALREIGDPVAVPGLIAALGDRAFTVRMAAQRALMALGRPAEKAAMQAWRTAGPAAKRHLLCVLAAGNSWSAWRGVRAATRDPDPEVRGDATLLVGEGR